MGRAPAIAARIPLAGALRAPLYFGRWRNTERGGGVNEVFRALGDPTRRQILQLLKRGDFSAGEIAERFPLAKSTLSGHFSVLKHANLIVAERRGTTIVYSLNLSVLEEATAAVLEILSHRQPKERSR
jgi:ArsR family transcriptional regulator